ncbi:hypothetical protein HG536_0A04680 [Torulaspora globosa]|uniref:Formate/nitrite transporter n=1 Tax=Torulaspora globosa TaxID=48254 RepID=A0A7G3ZAW6_9SACH|nr:uncharacterized protein HG536_0A04680 [Torulaspora globosa]QLL30652.1 hypothetical protein HG536_0A04680 [Torulaspora globosa]
MVADDAYYLTPHEAALAVVATAMKKARLQIGTLTLNSLLGGILFSAGSIMAVAAHSENPTLMRDNPGLADSFSGVLFGIGLFYVVIMGADLYNSNILFFSVGLLRRAVSVYDLVVSWFVSLLGNLAGSLFVSYLFCHVSKVSSSELWKTGSRNLVESKASFSFMETFLKGIAGNFFVCLAIYLQLMAKPIHVRLILIILPVFTFVSCGFTHVVADMALSFIGMLNGADVSVGEYIWKLLIPAAVGNAIGGSAFGLVVPFYLHLVVVENDRKKLSLPEYDARDEQPELNTDSRVVRVSPLEEKEEELENEEEEESESLGKRETDVPDGSGGDSSDIGTSLSPQRSLNSDESSLREYSHSYHGTPALRTVSLKSVTSRRSSRSLRSVGARSPPGVFPVRGMREPLGRERTIENPYFDALEEPLDESHEHERKKVGWQGSLSPPAKSIDAKRSSSGYSVLEDKPGAKLEKAITKLVENSHRTKTLGQLPRTTQETFPHNRPDLSPSYTAAIAEIPRWHRTGKHEGLSRQIRSSETTTDSSSIERSLRRAEINHIAAVAANSVAGVADFDTLDFPVSHSPRTLHRTRLRPPPEQFEGSIKDEASMKANSVSIGVLQNDSNNGQQSIQRIT